MIVPLHPTEELRLAQERRDALLRELQYRQLIRQQRAPRRLAIYECLSYLRRCIRFICCIVIAENALGHRR